MADWIDCLAPLVVCGYPTPFEVAVCWFSGYFKFSE